MNEASNNLPEVLAAMNAVKMRVLTQLELASVEIGLRLEQKAKHQIVGDRKSVGYPAVSGKPPMNNTGQLRANIKSRNKRIGFGIYVAEVGSYMIYARAVELGGAPTWKNGQKFPYMKPALDQFKKSNSIKRILIPYLRKAING